MKKFLLLILLTPYSCYGMDLWMTQSTTLPKHTFELLGQKPEPTPLHMACIDGHWPNVQQEIAKPDCAINKRARVNYNCNASTPLYLACQNGYTNIVELLLTVKEIKVNKGDLIETYGKPLHVAKYLAIAKLLIENNADINATNGIANQTPLMKHILARRYAVATYLIEAGADVHHKDMNGQTALFYALQFDHSSEMMNIMYRLLMAGAHPIQDTALIVERYAFNESHGIGQLACYLLSLKRHLFYIFSLHNPQNENNPIYLLQNNAALLKHLYNQSNGVDSITKSLFPMTQKEKKKSLYQALDVVKQVLKITRNGSDSSDISKRAACLYGRLFLYQATRQDLETLFGKKSISYVQFLLNVKKLFKCIKKGEWCPIENTLTPSLWGTKPTPHAQWSGKNMDDIKWCDKNMIEYAFKHKKPRCLTALFSSYPQYNALCCGDVNEFYSRFDTQLLQPESDAECRLALQKGLCTELQFAIAKENFDEVQRLVELGINVNAYNEGGYAPLHVAACNEHDDARFVDLLIAAGADVNIRSSHEYPHEKAPLSFAAKGCNGKIVHSLLKAKADINCFPLSRSCIENLLFSPVINKKISQVKELIENGIYIHEEYSELAEKGLCYMEKYDCPEISAMLKKAYEDEEYPYAENPKCCVCLGYCVDDIPCSNEHPRSFLCAGCCGTVRTATNKCPICREELIEEKKADAVSSVALCVGGAKLDEHEELNVAYIFINNFEDSESEESIDGFALF